MINADAPRTETKDILVSFVVAMVRMSSWKKAKSANSIHTINSQRP